MHAAAVTPWVARLRAFAAPAEWDTERCELCGRAVEPGHPHLAEPARRRLLCACPSCAAGRTADTDGPYRLVPTETTVLTAVCISDAHWEALAVPVDLAFFFYSTPDGRCVALYPGPGGAIASGLDLAAWAGLAAANPVLRTLRPDVEAVLVNRLGGAREYYRAPIDRCYALIGTIRRRWRGLGGGAGVEEALREFRAAAAAERRHA